MVGFFKYIVFKLGNTSFWLGLFCMIGITGVTIYEAAFYARAITVVAGIDDIETLCVLKWKETNSLGKSRRHTSDRMDCAQAAAIKQANPLQSYRLEEKKRSYLVYSVPNGKTLREWSNIHKDRGVELKRGDRLMVMIDPRDPADLRTARGLSDLAMPAIAIVCCVIAMFIGWILKGIGRGGGLPEPFWRWGKRKPRLQSELAQLHSTVRRRRAF